MIKKFNIIIFLFIIVLINNFSYAESSIRFVDLDYIFSNSIAGKKINTQIQKDSKSINNEMNNYQKEIDDEKKKLINQKNILAKDEFNSKSLELEKKIIDYNKKISNKNKKLLELKKNVKSEFSKLLREILQDYAKINSIQMIVNKDTILIGKKDLDASKEILVLFDKKVKNFKIK